MLKSFIKILSIFERVQTIKFTFFELSTRVLKDTRSFQVLERISLSSTGQHTQVNKSDWRKSGKSIAEGERRLP